MTLKHTAYKGRFGEMAAVTPQKQRCEHGSYYPAGTLVKPLPRQAAGLLCASSESAVALRREELKICIINNGHEQNSISDSVSFVCGNF